MSQGSPVLQAQAVSLLSLAHAWPRYARAEAVAANGPAQNGANIFHFTCFFNFTARVRGSPQVPMLGERERERERELIVSFLWAFGLVSTSYVCSMWGVHMLGFDHVVIGLFIFFISNLEKININF